MDINFIRKKGFVVFTAIDLLHENGINNISTKEIAKRIGISESLIFKIYPKKNDLILAVLDQFSLYDKDMFLTAQNKYEDVVEAILFYFDNYLLYYENYPAITGVYQILDLQSDIPEIEEKTKVIYLNRLENLMQLIGKAQDKGRLKQSETPELLADVLYSTFKGMCMKWRKMGFSFSLRESTNRAIKLILKSLTI